MLLRSYQRLSGYRSMPIRLLSSLPNSIQLSGSGIASLRRSECSKAACAVIADTHRFGAPILTWLIYGEGSV